MKVIELKLDRSRSYGIVLEGGGARGAYQIGAWRALREAGISIKGAAGTSVGALNGALICMDDLDKAEEIWENIRYSRVMDVDDDVMEQLHSLGSLRNVGSVLKILKRLLSEGGFDIGPLRSLIREAADESRLRASERELYVVTYSITDRMPVVADIKEVPEGEIADILMASAYLIGFRQEKLGGKYYMDGARVNNVPVDVLMEKGYKDIIVFRIYGYGVDTEKRLEIPEDVNLYHVAPRQNLGGILEFNQRRSRRNMTLGYLDCQRMLYGLEGRLYYLDAPESELYYLEQLLFQAESFLGWLKPELGTAGSGTAGSGTVGSGTAGPGTAGPEAAEQVTMRRCMEEHFPKLAQELRLKSDWNYKDLYLALLEELAGQYRISRLKIYTPGELYGLIAVRAGKAAFSVAPVLDREDSM